MAIDQFTSQQRESAPNVPAMPMFGLKAMAPNESGVSELALWRVPCARTARDRAEVSSEGRVSGVEAETDPVMRCCILVDYSGSSP